MPLIDRTLVSDFALFSGLSDAEIDDVLREARSVRFPKNTAVFEQGGEARSVFVLLHGRVRAAKGTPEGEQIVVRYVSPGEVFGVAMAIGMTTYPATATAVVDSVVLVWPSETWAHLMAANPKLAANAMKSLGGRLQEAHARVIEMTTEEVERRVARALLRLAQQAGRKVERGVEIDFPISRLDVAEMTGTTLHTVSRILSAWEHAGLVEGGRQRISIREPHKLYLLVEGGGLDS
jgi:CRP/FNR family transcriptional regulator, nitrogen oxide reductase regulator